MRKTPALLDPLRWPAKEDKPTSASFDLTGFDPFKARVAVPEAKRPGHRAFTHSDYGTCPYCRSPMVDAYLPDGEIVKFCTIHRCSLPQPK